MSLGGGGGQLQELASRIEELEEHREALEAEIQRLQAEKANVDQGINAIRELESDSTVQVPLGGGAYVHAEVKDIDEVIVPLGSEYAAERDREGAIDTLESKKETLDERISGVREEINDVESESNELEQQMEQARAQQMQQMQAQQGQGQQRDE